MKLDPKLRSTMSHRAADLRQEASDLRHRASLLDAQASRLERVWELRPLERIGA